MRTALSTLRCFAVIASILLIEEAAAVQEEKADAAIVITVLPGGRQTFAGFGTSLGNWGGEYQTLPAERREELSRMIWSELGFKILRLWVNMNELGRAPGSPDLLQFRKNYVDSGIIADARKNGVTTLLLAPESLPPRMVEKNNDGNLALKAGSEKDYAVLLADVIDELKKETGVLLDVTGVQNEPNEKERFSPAQIATVVVELRNALDARGLQHVQIIAPEHASADDVLIAQTTALQQNETAWTALEGVASHSYNMGAMDRIAEMIAAPDGGNTKEYWMTEASDNGPEQPGDRRRAASLSSRFLNDMNHRVTHWIHFLGFEVTDPKDNATRIIAYDPSPFRQTVFAKYYSYRQLSQAFDVGAVFRTCTSSLDGSMTWGFGLKPRVTAAAARNPDGRWSIGLSNYTAERFDDEKNWGDEKWNREQGGHTPAQTFQVTIQIPELRDRGEITFNAWRTSDTSPTSAILREGELTIAVTPLELVTLRSKDPVRLDPGTDDVGK